MLLVHLVARMFAPRHSAQSRFLKAQLRILRRRIPAGRIVPGPDEKAELLRLGEGCGHDVAEILEIVQPRTYRRRLNDVRRGGSPNARGGPGSDKTSATWSFAWEKGTCFGAIGGLSVN